MKTINKKKESGRSFHASREATDRFDAVKMMREIRDKISAETENMTLEELKAYIKSQLKKSEFKPIGK